MANTPVRQYIGARYVPLFADPAEWDNTKTYEPLTIVLHEGNSYTSRQYVPTGIDITNTNFWALTGNYNAQIEAYRKEAQNTANILNHINWNTPEAAAQWINNSDTRTTANTTTLQNLGLDTPEKAQQIKPTTGNIILYGADPTGNNDISDIVNNMATIPDIRTIYIPAGTYALDKSINITNKHLKLETGALITARAPMDTMITLDGALNDESIYPMLEYSGGCLNANGQALTCLKTGDNIRIIQNAKFTGAKTICLNAETSHAAKINNIIIEGNHTCDIGIKLNYDCYLTNTFIWDCKLGVYAPGTNFFDNLYIWGGNNQSSYQSKGLVIKAGTAICGSLYLDCLALGVSGEDWYIAKIAQLNIFANTADMPDPIQSVAFSMQGCKELDITQWHARPDKTVQFAIEKAPTTIKTPTPNNTQNMEGATLYNLNNKAYLNPIVFAYDVNVPANKALKICDIYQDTLVDIEIRTVYGDVIKKMMLSKRETPVIVESLNDNGKVKFYYSDTSDARSIWILYTSALNGQTWTIKTETSTKYMDTAVNKWATPVDLPNDATEIHRKS